MTFHRTILGNVEECRTECEISDHTGTIVAIVYEGHEGWHVKVFREPNGKDLAAFNVEVEAAKQSLLHYVNRVGSNPPTRTTTAGLSLWLMQTDDGRALGIQLQEQESDPAFLAHNVSPHLEKLLRSLALAGHRVEAIRELRLATKCSLEQANAWLKDNC